jgi:YgiT-type zinc finger domain-containing protein
LQTRRGKSGESYSRAAEGESTIIIKKIPAEFCENCGEYYFGEQNTDQILAAPEDAAKKHVEVEILRFAA